MNVRHAAALAVSTALVLGTVFVAAPPAGAAGDSVPPELNSVTCATGTNCFAVGTRVIGSVNRTLIKSWNGTSWSVAPSPNPPGKTNAFLNGVACVSATSCLAVGDYSTSSWSRTLVEQWNGTGWSIVASPNPHGQTLASLNSVTCISATSCIAAGNYATKSWGRTLIEQWNGTGWSIVASPNPHGQTFASLDGIACPAATSCFAAGSDTTHDWARTLVEQWNGAAWQIVASPNPPGRNFAVVGSVACPTGTSCYAAGFYMDKSTTKTLVEHWNGAAWQIVASPNPTPGLLEFAGLGGVACVSSTDCSAVGFAVTSLGSRTLIEHWDGASWSIATSPNQPGALDFPALLAVECTTGTSCIAVGFSNNKVLVDRWNGAQWSTEG